jgi:hypothetical protein
MQPNLWVIESWELPPSSSAHGPRRPLTNFCEFRTKAMLRRSRYDQLTPAL